MLTIHTYYIMSFF